MFLLVKGITIAAQEAHLRQGQKLFALYRSRNLYHSKLASGAEPGLGMEFEARLLVPSYHTEGYQKTIYHSHNLQYIYCNYRNIQYAGNMNSEVLESIRAFRNGSCPVYWAAVPDKSSTYPNRLMKLGVHS